MATVILTPHSVAVGSINPSENGAAAAGRKKWSPIFSALLSVGKGRSDRRMEGRNEGVIPWNAELPSLSCNSDLSGVTVALG